MASVIPQEARSQTPSAIRSRQWRENNRERHLENSRKNASAWYGKNRERALEYRRRYRAEKPDLVREQLRRWRAENKEYVSVLQRCKSARRKSAPGTYSPADIRRLLASQRGLCVYCRNKLSDYHIDHIKPIALGGDSFPANLQLLCPFCNMSKGAKDPVVFARSRGLLL